MIDNVLKCEICSGTLNICKINSDYHICDICNTQTLNNRESFETDFYANLYLEENDDGIIKFLENNNSHYERFFNVLNKDIAYLEVMKNININTCHCFGGGFPMLEARLPFTHINIYDLIANKYLTHVDKYLKVFNVDKKINYKVHDLKNGFIKTDSITVFTFIHILEHFPLKDIFKTFNILNDTLKKDSYVFIYQPNPKKATTKKWFHYINQHITFIDIDSFTDIINNHDNLEVVYTKEYSDDLYIIFKRV